MTKSLHSKTECLYQANRKSTNRTFSQAYFPNAKVIADYLCNRPLGQTKLSHNKLLSALLEIENFPETDP